MELKIFKNFDFTDFWKSQYSENEILDETDESQFEKRRKNIFITNSERNIRLTINSFTNRMITADKLKK